jgi:hypothetical protein
MSSQNYLIIHSNNSKHLKRRIKKQNLSHLCKWSNYKKDFETESVQLLINFLNDVKQQQRLFNYKNPPWLGVLTDDNILLENIGSLPTLPNCNWDVLFLEYELTNINSNHLTPFWSKIQTHNSRHFVINPYSINKILNILHANQTWSKCIEEFCKLNTFGILQNFCSQRVKNYITSSHLKNIQDYKTDLINKYNTDQTQVSISQDTKNTQEIIQDIFLKNDSPFEKLSPDKRYRLYPNISFICYLTDHKLFLHTLYTFLSIDYPTDKIELVVIDDTDSEKSLKNKLPNDSRIRFVNVRPKEPSNVNIPLGYKLNLAIQYCKYDLIFHLFDTNIYFKQNFKHLVECYLLSGKDILLSSDMCINTDNDFNKINFPDLGNMIYSRNYWKSFNFKSNENDRDTLTYLFTSFRKSMNQSIPFIHWSYNLTDNCYSKESQKPLSINLHKLLTDKDYESLQLIFS